MNLSPSPRRKAFLAVQTALALMIAAPMTALGRDVNDTNANGYLYDGADYNGASHTIQNTSSKVFTNDGSGYFDFQGGNNIILGDDTGSENTVTLSSYGTGQHVIGELWDETGNPTDAWAEGNTVNLSGGAYGDVAGGVATGHASAGRANFLVDNNGSNIVNISGTATIGGGVFGGLATGDGKAAYNRVNITGGAFTASDEIYGGYLFSPGIFWIGFIVKCSGSFVQSLQRYS
jgi:hypothetical protein